jgi:hypothetical protein
LQGKKSSGALTGPPFVIFPAAGISCLRPRKTLFKNLIAPNTRFFRTG